MRQAILPLLGLLLSLPVQAQVPQVLFRGRGDPGLDARIRELLREPGRVIWTSDTTIARNDTVRGPLLVVGATVRLEGVLEGDVAAVGADFFVRPSARVAGDVRSFAGGWYASDLATVTGELDHRPNAPYAVERSPNAITIRGTRNPRLLAFDPIVPGYDRVDGLSPGVESRLLLPPLERLESTLAGWGSYRTERGQLTGGASVLLARGGTSAAAGVERTTLTNEVWIRGTLGNAASYLFDGNDIRDYYEADRAWVELRRKLEDGGRETAVWMRGQVEDARSLRADNPWTLLKPDSLRPNRQVDEGRVGSVLAGAMLAWRRPTFETVFEGVAEFGLDALDSDYEFSSYRLDLDWAMLALRNHTLEIDAHFQGPMPFFDYDCSECDTSDRRIPRQRWSHVGGSGTLPTFGDAAFQGDHVLFIESRYGIPLGPRLRVPFLGIPTFEVLHAVGKAWTRERSGSLEHNVGFRLRYNVIYVRVISNPEDLAADVEFSVGVNFPRRAYGWQPAGGFF